MPSLTDSFATLAGGYDVVLSDVWGVIHNGVAATAPACDALIRFRGQGGTVMLITNAPRPGEVVTRFLDKLAVPRTALEMRKRGHHAEAVDRLIFQNPARFLSQCPKFKLPEPEGGS